MEVSETRVIITGCTPGGDVILVSSAKRVRDGMNASETTPQLIKADATGRVVVDGSVPLRSVWLAVDMESGSYDTGARTGFPLAVAPVKASLFRKDAANEIAEIDAEHVRTYLLLVRPGKGAWSLRLREGSPKDRDGAKGRARIAFEDTIPIGTGKDAAPKNLKNGDIVAMIDLGYLTLYIGTVGK